VPTARLYTGASLLGAGSDSAHDAPSGVPSKRPRRSLNSPRRRKGARIGLAGCVRIASCPWRADRAVGRPPLEAR
jgi:hypothetical protein